MVFLKKKPDWGDILLVYIGMYAAWSLWQIFAQPLLIGPGWIPSLLNIAVKALIWLGPLVFYRKAQGWKIAPREMFTSPFPWFGCLAMVCGSVAFLQTVRILSGRMDSHLIWDPIFILFSASAGVIEEISFRGFIFNRQAAFAGMLPAALINGMLFAVFHYPSWIIGQGFLLFFTWRFWMLVVVGILFSMAFAKWKNIWLTIAVHTFWNLLSYLWALV